MPKNEYEIVDHARLRDIKLFIVDLAHRNLHMHKEFELCLMLSGEVELYVQKKTFLLQRGNFFLLNPKQPHEIHARQDERARILSLQVSPKFCARYFPLIQRIEFDPIAIRCESADATIRLIRETLLQLAAAYFRGDDHYELSCYALLNHLFHTLLLTVPWHALSDSEHAAKTSVSERLNRILDYIDNHFTEKILLSDLALRENLSLTYLSHYFKNNLNMTFQEYVSLLRFEAARSLIEHTDDTITDIGIACGFSDNRYLNRAFRQQLACTPSEYRQRYLDGRPITVRRGRSSVQRFLAPAECLHVLDGLGEDRKSVV